MKEECVWYDDQRQGVSVDCPFVKVNSFERCKGCPTPQKEVAMNPEDRGGTVTYAGDRGTQVTKIIISPKF